MPSSEIQLSPRHAHHLATLISALLDKVGALEGLLQDQGYQSPDDTDRLLIAGQRVVHHLREIAAKEKRE